MAYELIKEDGASKVVKFTMAAVELKKIFRKTKKDISKEVSIRGFRPGHVPDSIIDKKYGNIIVAEVAEKAHKILSTKLFEEVDWVLSDKAPDFDNILPVEGEEYSYQVTFHVFETPELVDYKGIELTVPKYDLDDIVEKTLEDVSKQFVEYEETDEPSVENNLVIVTYPGMGEDNADEKEINLVVGQETIGEGIDDFIVGVRPGDIFSAQMIGKEEGAAASSPPVTFTVKDVKSHKFPELDNEFAKKIAGLDSIEEYRQKIRDDASAKFEEEVTTFKTRQLIEKLLESNKFDVPQFMINNLTNDFLKEIDEEERTEETTKMAEEMAEKKVREFLILREVAIKENLSSKQEEIDAAVAEGDSKAAFVDRNRNDLALDFLIDSAVIEETEPVEPAGPQNPSPWKWEKVELVSEEAQSETEKVEDAPEENQEGEE